MNANQLSHQVRSLSRAQFARLIDHTQVRAQASQRDLTQLCNEALRYHFAAVAVNPVWVSYCAKRLGGSDVGIAACVGFPLGATTANIKVEEAREAVGSGATEVDVVINLGALKSGFPDFVQREIAALVKAVGKVPVKVILEAGLLTTEEKITVCELSQKAGAAFVKTSTGFGPSGADLDDVALMRRTVGDAMGVKAAGGIRTYADAVHMVESGANRLGTSAGVAILEEMPG